MNNINEVINNLYKALVAIRYPGIAQIDINNVESTVATNNRIPMLHWLARHSLNVCDSNFNPPTADETSIVQWFTELGVCTNREALLGECSLKEQSDTLIRLTNFIMNGFDQSLESLDSCWDIATKYWSSTANVIPSASKFTANLKYKAVEEYVRGVEQSVKDAEENIHKLNMKDEPDDSPLEKNIEDNKNGVEARKDQSLVLEKFYESFKSIKVKNNDQKFSENINFIDKYMTTVPQQLTMIKEVLDNEANISETVISKGPVLKENPSNEIVEDVVTGLESFSKDYNPDFN